MDQTRVNIPTIPEASGSSLPEGANGEEKNWKPVSYWKGLTAAMWYAEKPRAPSLAIASIHIGDLGQINQLPYISASITCQKERKCLPF